ncbi:MAG: BamA/OMP85 family outer membrane protein [Gemmatimonadaceae bacterium]
MKQPTNQGMKTVASHPEIVNLTIKGVKSLDETLLRNHLAIGQSHCVSLLLKPICIFSKSPLVYKRVYLEQDELARDVLRARVFYFQRGYRDMQVDTTVTPVGHADVHVTLNVREGPPTAVTSLNVVQTDTVLSRKGIAKASVLEKGDPLSLLALDSTQALLKRDLWDRGYADAVIDSALVIDTAAHAVAVTLTVDPRWVARVASIDVQGEKLVSPRTIRKSLSFKPGDVYRRSDVLKSQRSLYESNLFRRASIQVPERDDSLKHVLIVVQEDQPRSALTSVGFSTVDFVQVHGRYINYDWLGGAKRLTLDAAVGNLFARQLNGNGIFYDVGKAVIGDPASKYFAPTYTASGEFRYPWFGSPNNEAALGVFAHRRSSPGIYVDRGYGASATLTRLLTERGPASLNYRYELTKVDAGDVYFCVNYGVCDAPTLGALRRNQSLSPIGLSLTLDKTDNPFEPRSGYRTQGSLESASTFTLSDFRYNRAVGDVAMFLPVRTKSVLAGHLRVGYVDALSSTAAAVGADTNFTGSHNILHPRTRFYAGGSQSVRGYGESQLGPRVLTIPAQKLRQYDTTSACRTDVVLCNPALAPHDQFTARPLGGNRLIEGSVEFRFPIYGDFLGAAFVDAAYLSQNSSPALPKSKAAVTPGVGVRYQSLVGPVRVDIGLNPSVAEDLPVVTQDAVATNGSLVRLNQRRTYSVAGGGGIGGILSRLTLHLSIGEAF